MNEIGVDLQTDRNATVGAFGIDHRLQVLAPQSPLHEGRRNRVDPSSSKEALTVIERDPMRGLFCGYRVSPIDVSSVPPVKERQPCVQLIEDTPNPFNLKPHACRDHLQAQRLLRSG